MARTQAAATEDPTANPRSPQAEHVQEERAKRGKAPRRISSEVMKAETVLLRINQTRLAAIERHHAELVALTTKRQQFIDGLPDDVVNMLVAGGVVYESELGGADSDPPAAG